MKKGFTLIELLAVIAILSIVSAIAYPKIIDVIGASRLTAYNVSKSNIVDSAKLKYLADVTSSSSVTEYSIKELIDTGYVKNGAKNPLTNDDFDNDTKVLITNENGNVNYDFVEGKTIYDYVSNKDEKSNVYRINNELIFKGYVLENYAIFNGEIYRIMKVDKYRRVYLIKESSKKLYKNELLNYENNFINDNFDENATKKIYGKASVISTDLYNQTFINNISYINMDNNDWIKDNNEYITIGMNKEIVNSDYAKTYITIKLNNNIIVTGGNGTQLNPYVLN